MKKIGMILMTAFLAVCSMDAKVVRGKVTCGNQRLEQVLVTDGTSFTRTNARGRFSFEISDDAEFVYIVTPKGYTAPYASGAPAFYLPATQEGPFHFDLLEVPDSGDYTIIAMADPQTKTPAHFQLYRERVVPELVSTASARQQESVHTVGIALGDIVWDNLDLFPAFKETFVQTGIPFYPVIGNHDYQKEAVGDDATARGYREQFGPENYAFCLGDDYMIVLDNIVYDTQKNYVETFTEDQLRWVGELLKYIPTTSCIWLSMHCPFKRWFRPEEPLVGLGKEMLELLEGRQVMVLSGHTHINNVLQLTPTVQEHNIAAACGAWWATGHCTDGTPGGFKVFEKKDGRITWYYQSLGRDRDDQMEVFGPGESEDFPEAVLANVWDCDENWTVEWFQDGKAMGPMEQVTTCSPAYLREINAIYRDKGKPVPNYKKPRPNLHYFKAVPAASARQVEVRATSSSGRQFSTRIDLMPQEGESGEF